MPVIRPIETVIDRLVAAGCVAANEEAAELTAAAPDDATLEYWLVRREHGEPLAWITGAIEFCGHTIHVGPGVYEPRRQSEELARRAAAVLSSRGILSSPGILSSGGVPRAVDLCTGAGAIAAHLQAESPGAAVAALDVDGTAAACARRNGVRAVVADLTHPLPFRSTAFDVVTAVPPYVPTGELHLLPADVQRFEPRRALDGGRDGLDMARLVVVAAARLLRPGGWLLIELGGRQDELLAPTLTQHGFDAAEPWHDDEGDLRGLAARAAPA